MKWFAPTLAVLMLVLFAASPCATAQRQLVSEVQLGLSAMLKFNGVARDLELVQEQHDQLDGLWVEVEMKLEYAFKEYRDNYSPRFSPDEQQRLADDLEAAIEEVRAFEMERLEEALLPAQLDRLKQIRFQVLKQNSGGLQGLAKELSLSDEQIAKLKSIQASYRQEMVELKQRAVVEQLTPRETREDVAAAKANHQEQLMDVLNFSQQAKLKRLQGSPFHLQTGTPPAKEEEED